MSRFEDWPTKLEEFLELRREMPWLWSRHDCVTFAAGAVESMTGREFVDWKDEYNDPSGAMRALQKRELKGPADWADENFEEIHPAMAQRGDLVLLPSERGPWRSGALGICTGRYAACADEVGYHLEHMSRALRAWRVMR